MTETQALRYGDLFDANRTPGRVSTIVVVANEERRKLLTAAFGQSSKTRIVTPGQQLAGCRAELILVEKSIMDSAINRRWFQESLVTRLAPANMGIHAL